MGRLSCAASRSVSVASARRCQQAVHPAPPFSDTPVIYCLVAPVSGSSSLLDCNLKVPEDMKLRVLKLCHVGLTPAVTLNLLSNKPT